MEWLTDLLKHLAISRAFVVAVFVTSLVMVVGPTLYPAQVPIVPQPWPAAVFAAMILSGTLLVLWVVAAGWSLLRRAIRTTSTAYAASALSQGHVDVLCAMGEHPSHPLNLENINYDQAPFSRLEIAQLVRELELKGLASVNGYSENLVSLTQAGRERALEIQRQVKAKGSV